MARSETSPNGYWPFVNRPLRGNGEHVNNNTSSVRIGSRVVGDEAPVFVIGEIGINHNGSLDIAKELIAGAARAGADAVKFQKRTPEKCVPRDQWMTKRQTPWGCMTYIDYRHRLEFGFDEYAEIDRCCRQHGLLWFASCWDEEAVDFILEFDPPCFKASSACLTDLDLLRKQHATGRPLMISTGMSTMTEIVDAVRATGTDRLLIAHSTSTYPCPTHELNLKMISTLRYLYPGCPIGYSGHEVGLAPTWAAVAMGATFIERHVTLDRAMWGSDQAASVEISGFERLVSNIRDIERAMGDGMKRVCEGELEPRRRLRRMQAACG
jgi:N-acetylneuraminate synthase